MSDDATERNGRLRIPLPFEEAVRAAIEVGRTPAPGGAGRRQRKRANSDEIAKTPERGGSAKDLGGKRGEVPD